MSVGDGETGPNGLPSPEQQAIPLLLYKDSGTVPHWLSGLIFRDNVGNAVDLGSSRGVGPISDALQVFNQGRLRLYFVPVFGSPLTRAFLWAAQSLLFATAFETLRTCEIKPRRWLGVRLSLWGRPP